MIHKHKRPPTSDLYSVWASGYEEGKENGLRPLKEHTDARWTVLRFQCVCLQSCVTTKVKSPVNDYSFTIIAGTTRGRGLSVQPRLLSEDLDESRALARLIRDLCVNLTMNEAASRSEEGVSVDAAAVILPAGGGGAQTNTDGSFLHRALKRSKHTLQTLRMDRQRRRRRKREAKQQDEEQRDGVARESSALCHTERVCGAMSHHFQSSSFSPRHRR